jgi:hypothetical protein
MFVPRKTCISTRRGRYPNITPVISFLSQDSSPAGKYTIVYISGYNYLPFDTTRLNFGPYKNIPITYLSSYNLAFEVPLLSPGTYNIQLATINQNQLLPVYVVSNIVTYTIT